MSDEANSNDNQSNTQAHKLILDQLSNVNVSFAITELTGDQSDHTQNKHGFHCASIIVVRESLDSVCGVAGAEFLCGSSAGEFSALCYSLSPLLFSTLALDNVTEVLVSTVSCSRLELKGSLSGLGLQSARATVAAPASAVLWLLTLLPLLLSPLLTQ